jgi:DNA polymerase III epsilon subunit-like protein
LPNVRPHTLAVLDDLDARELTNQGPEIFDTLKLARRLLPAANSYKLGQLVDVFKLAEELPAGLTPHRATYDALVAARLFVRLARPPGAHPLSLEELRGDKAPTLF